MPTKQGGVAPMFPEYLSTHRKHCIHRLHCLQFLHRIHISPRESKSPGHSAHTPHITPNISKPPVRLAYTAYHTPPTIKSYSVCCRHATPLTLRAHQLHKNKSRSTVTRTHKSRAFSTHGHALTSISHLYIIHARRRLSSYEVAPPPPPR